MSLTGLLNKNKKVIELFKEIPDVKHLLKNMDEKKEAFPNHIEIVAPPPKETDPFKNPANVGTAYDFWLRAYIQRINNINVEKNLSPQVAVGIDRMFEDEAINYKERNKFLKKAQEIWNIREKYILGEKILAKDLFEGMAILAYFEAYFRSRKEREEGYLTASKVEMKDLVKIALETRKVSNYFKVKRELVCNPNFGESSILVGGADADFLIDKTLVDIKTTKYYKYHEKDIHQLIGYYILNTYSHYLPGWIINSDVGTPKRKIENLALFYPRFNQYIYFSIKELETIFNIEEFAKKFYKLAIKIYENKKEF